MYGRQPTTPRRPRRRVAQDVDPPTRIVTRVKIQPLDFRVYDLASRGKKLGIERSLEFTVLTASPGDVIVARKLAVAACDAVRLSRHVRVQSIAAAADEIRSARVRDASLGDEDADQGVDRSIMRFHASVGTCAVRADSQPR